MCRVKRHHIPYPKLPRVMTSEARREVGEEQRSGDARYAYCQQCATKDGGEVKGRESVG